ncbi:nephrin-like [Panulirus ornatus]|uniref:nephrin-like n=1 Tax=Panulirus ornatus TaxID=150431 RepID=UPI003A8C701C
MRPSSRDRRGPRGLRLVLTSVLLFYATEGAAVEIQEFRVRPENVQVRAGEDVYLRCVVGNQQGKAQWTKDGFALGFERGVPGYPRYQYSGEATLGEHHLIIKGVTLEDDGEYQCQVGPTMTSLPIWAAANVTVMVAPRSIAVVGRDDDVVEVAAGAPVTLECLVSDARPAPSVAWYRDDVRVDPKLQKDTVKPSSETPRLASLQSRLELTALEADDGERYTCRALHPALWHGGASSSSRRQGGASSSSSSSSSSRQGGASSSSSSSRQGASSSSSSSSRQGGTVASSASSSSSSAAPLEASVTLSVLHPPGPPVITGYRTGEVLQAGERRTLTCKVSGGNPRPWVTWYWHERLGAAGAGGHNTTSSSSSSRKSVYLRGKAIIRRGKKPRGVMVNQRVTASRAEDGAVYECRVSSDQLPRPITTNVTLTVHYAPAQVKVSGPTVAAAGEAFTLTCLTSPANPPATLTWTLAGAQTNGTSTVVSEAQGGGWLTSSRLTLQAPRSSQVRSMSVKCEAHHPGHEEEVISHSREVTIIRPPGPPVVEVNTRGQVEAGASLEVTCASEGGHPPPQFRLYKGGASVPTEVGDSRGNVSTVRASVTVSPADNGARLVCEVSNPATSTPLAAHTTLDILYPAWEVKGWVSPKSVEAGQVAKLTCETSSSVPPSTITWLPSTTHALGQPSVKHSPGLYGGTVTRSQVKVRLLADNDGDLVTCRVENELGLALEANITLDVLRESTKRFRWLNAILANEGHNEGRNEGRNEGHNEGRSGGRNEGRNGGRNEGHNEGRSGGHNEGHNKGHNEGRNEGRNEGHNGHNEGRNGHNEGRNVGHNEGPTWAAKPPGRISVLEGQDLTITAAAVANPGPVRYSWRNGSQEVTGSDTSNGELSLGPARRQHTGNYTVAAQSPRGSLISAFYLDVLYGPEDVLAVDRVVAEEEGAATILCSAVGNPTPNITWTKEVNDNTRNTTRVLSTGVGEARLTVECASRSDTGVYFCHASSRVSTAPPTSSTLVVKQSPWWSNENPDEVVGRSWAAVGGQGRLECRVRAAPPPTFHWATQDGREIKPGDKYTVNAPKLVDGVVEWSSVLEIKGVTPRDHAGYTCTATNTLGKHSYRLVLTPPVPPATPTHLMVANVTSGEALLLWTPNLAKSEPTGHVVRFWSQDDEYQYANVSGSTEATVTGLSSGTLYTFSVQAFNPQGRSKHTLPVHVTTLGVAESASSSSSSSADGAGGGATKSGVPHLILFIMTLAGTALLALNMAIIACFVRRRSTSQANRGVSASSSKTTTLEAFSPATTPGGAAQGDELPLTTTTVANTTDAATDGRQSVERHTGADHTEQTSLFKEDIGRSPILTPERDLLGQPPGSAPFRSRSQQNGRVPTQNGGVALQKYSRDDGCCYHYYYSPVPQGGAPGDEEGDHGGTRRIANPPDVCPTTADEARGTLSRRQHQHHQQKAHSEGVEAARATRPTDSPAAVTTQQQEHRSSHPQQEEEQHSTQDDMGHQQRLQCDLRPERHHQGQRRSSSWTATAGEGNHERLSHPLQQSPQQLRPQQFGQARCCDTPSSSTGPWSGGYATVGSRKTRPPPPAAFSTLQCPETLRPHQGPGQEAAIHHPQGRHHNRDLLSGYELQQGPLRDQGSLASPAVATRQDNTTSSTSASSCDYYRVAGSVVRQEVTGRRGSSRPPGLGLLEGESLATQQATASSPSDSCSSGNAQGRRRPSQDAAAGKGMAEVGPPTLRPPTPADNVGK